MWWGVRPAHSELSGTIEALTAGVEARLLADGLAAPGDEVVIMGGMPFASDVFLTHSSDLRTMQEIFHVTKPFFVGDAIHANDLSSLFADGAIPQTAGGCGHRDDSLTGIHH